MMTFRLDELFLSDAQPADMANKSLKTISYNLTFKWTLLDTND